MLYATGYISGCITLPPPYQGVLLFRLHTFFSLLAKRTHRGALRESFVKKKANTSAREGNFHAHQISRAPELASRPHAERQLRVPKNSIAIGVLRRTATRANVNEAYRWWRTSPHDFFPLFPSARKKRLRFVSAVLESFSILNGSFAVDETVLTLCASRGGGA